MAQATRNGIPDDSPLKFTFSPHLLEHLGVNLYTSLAKALVEFVANAYDANSPGIEIRFNAEKIKAQAAACRARFNLDLANKTASAEPKAPLIPLEKRTLDPAVVIVLEDRGHGMTKDELEDKFLVIGRPKREGPEGSTRSKGGKRVLMGRKGLGKLAGFGIAHRVEVASRAVGCDYTTVITLDYDALLGGAKGPLDQASVVVPTTVLVSGGLKRPGTRITLSRLVYQTLHSANEEDIVVALGRHFGIIDPKDFKIRVNRVAVAAPKKKYEYAWPEDDKRGHEQLVSVPYGDADTGQTYSFSYRLRFTESKKYLLAMERGVRIYAHNRLTSFPSLLDVSSNAHGFRYSDYLDGVAVADFIDELPTDLIATDRSDLRWETPPLAGLRQFLGNEIKKALARFADKKMAEQSEKVKEDPYTQQVIEKADLPEHRKQTAFKFATALASSETQGVQSDYYKTTLEAMVSSLGHGDIIGAINKLAQEDHPDLSRLVAEITRSTKREFDEFLRFAQVRIRGIEGLEKIVRAQDFRSKKCDEKSLQRLFSKSPWLIDPSLSQFVTSDERETVLAGKLAKHLKVARYVPKGYNPNAPDEQEPLRANKRPDLVFLLSHEPRDGAIARVTVVELKAPNIPLHSGHLDQLEDYIRDIERWRDAAGRSKMFEVRGQLIGSLGIARYKGDVKVQRLEGRIRNYGRGAKWEVRDIEDVLADTKAVHKALLTAFENAETAG